MKNGSMQNHSEIAEFLWKIADLIKDDYEAKDYEDVILPFTLRIRMLFVRTNCLTTGETIAFRR